MLKLRVRPWRLAIATGLLVPFALTNLLYFNGPFVRSGPIIATPLSPPHQPEGWPADLSVHQVWQLTAERADLGSYSAMLVMPGDRLRLYSDKGGFLELPKPGRSGGYVMQPVGKVTKGGLQDIESATRDPGSGSIWLGYEWYNGIRRLSADGARDDFMYPGSMKAWSNNAGPEAMVRLSNGRFIVLREINGEGLLFPRDPFDGGTPTPFRFDVPEGYNPVDIAQLPDGRVLVLVRGLRLAWPPFKAALIVADPATIRPSRPWRWEMLARLDGAIPMDNYEALAVEPDPSGCVNIWLASDSNQAAMQRTLLARLNWRPDQQSKNKKGATDQPGAPLR